VRQITIHVRRSNSAAKTAGAFRVDGAVISRTIVEMDQTKKGAQEVLLERMGRQLTGPIPRSHVDVSVHIEISFYSILKW